VLAVPPAPLALVGDMVRLSQLFSNLLINASKFSALDSTIFITASAHEGVLSVSIKDPGSGIAVQDQERIFDLFAQGPDELGHAAAGGLGIGLALVKSIAQMHGGSVRVVSDGIGCGSEFIVQLPLPPDPAAGPA
jgi:signal transduction histidine kinase